MLMSAKTRTQSAGGSVVVVSSSVVGTDVVEVGGCSVVGVSVVDVGSSVVVDDS